MDGGWGVGVRARARRRDADDGRCAYLMIGVDGGLAVYGSRHLHEVVGWVVEPAPGPSPAVLQEVPEPVAAVVALESRHGHMPHNPVASRIWSLLTGMEQRLPGPVYFAGVDRGEYVRLGDAALNWLLAAHQVVQQQPE